MIRIGLLGYGGRMGGLTAEEIAANDACVLSGGVVHEMKPEYKKAVGLLITPRAEEVIAISDAMVDFTTAAAAPTYARLAATYGKPFMSGTTGLEPEGITVLKEAARKIPVMHASNTSLSLAVMKRITALAAQLLSANAYDVAIHDEHHAQKKDAPSGTAKALGEAVVAGSGGKKTPRYSSVRAGTIVGEHEVIFAGTGETIRLHHSVTDRRIFARGAVEAILWLARQKPGFYGIDDMLRL